MSETESTPRFFLVVIDSRGENCSSFDDIEDFAAEVATISARDDVKQMFAFQGTRLATSTSKRSVVNFTDFDDEQPEGPLFSCEVDTD